MKADRAFLSLLIIGLLLSGCGNIPSIPTKETKIPPATASGTVIPFTPTPETTLTPIQLQAEIGRAHV